MEELSLDLNMQKIGRRAEAAIAQSRDALFAAAPADLNQMLGLQRTHLHGAIVVGASHVPNLHFNHVAGFGIDVPATEEALDALQIWYHQLNVPFTLSVSPLAKPVELLHWLNERNFVQDRATAILYFADQLTSLQQTSFTIQRVGADQALTFGQTLVEAFDLPPFMIEWMAATVGQTGWHHYLVWEGDAAVAAGILQVHNRVGHLGWAATYLAHRGRGAHIALIMQRLHDAHELGCDLIAVDTNFDGTEGNNISLKNVQRLGFRLLYMRPDYRSPDKNH